jgi:hypothetical protein
MEKKIETPRTRNREWGFYGTCRDAGHTDVEATWDEAMAALTDPKGQFALEPEKPATCSATWGRHLGHGRGGDQLCDPISDHRRWAHA